MSFRYPFKFENALYFLQLATNRYNSPFDYTPPEGGFVLNNEDEWNEVVWNDLIYTPGPTYEDLHSQEFNHDFGYEQLVLRKMYEEPHCIDDLQSDMSSAQSSIDSLSTVVGELGSPPATQDDLPDGDDFKQFSAAQKTKLDALPDNSTLTSTLSGKADASHTHTASEISDSSTVGRAVLTASNAGNARSAIGAGTSSFTGSYNDLTDKPTIPTTFDGLTDGTTNKAFTATLLTKLNGIEAAATANSSDATLLARANHTGSQAISTVTGLQTALDGKVATSRTINGHDLTANVTVTKSDIGLSNVDNTADASKTFSTSQITSGTFADALIAQSNVTQHQAALSIASTQITGTKTDTYISNFGSASRAAAQAYDGTTQRLGAFPICKSATVSSGVAVFHFTNDGLSTGTALFTNGPILASVSPTVNDSTASYQMGWAWSNSNKTLTVTTNSFTTANILSGILGQAPANGKTVNVTVFGY